MQEKDSNLRHPAYEAGELTAALSCNIARIPNGIRVRDCSKKGCTELFPTQLTTVCLIIHVIIISRKQVDFITNFNFI